MLFRPDINGLRAWAVVSVILFHFGIPGFSGGFVGVDVFFVLSGFLMMGILLSGVDDVSTGRLSAGRYLGLFYLARARRIFPALLVLCVLVLALGWFFLSPKEYLLLAKHIIITLVFLSNFRFSNESGYFDIEAHEKILLHTWSLAVEWQFYLLFPILVLVCCHISWGRRHLRKVLSVLALGSLVLSIFTSASMPERAFFLLPWRAWELLAGALVFLSARQAPRIRGVQIGLELAGLGLILGAVLLFGSNSIWPGWLAAIPVLGTALVLVAYRQDSILTGNAVAQWLGRCSYSLYLWHWPIVVALYYLELENDAAAIAVGVLLSVAFGWISYRLVETPIRVGLARLPSGAASAVILVMALLVILPSELVKVSKGVPNRMSPEARAIFAETENKNPRLDECHPGGDRPVPECTYGGPRLGAIVLGDSHAQSVVRSIEKALPMPELHILDWTRPGCKTIVGLKRADGEASPCEDLLALALRRNQELPAAPLVIVNRTSIDTDPEEAARSGVAPDVYVRDLRPARDRVFFDEIREQFVATACEFARRRPVYLVRPIPEMPDNVPISMGRARLTGGSKEISISLEEYRKRHAFVWSVQDEAAARCGVRILDPLPYLCSDGRCWGDVGGRPIYYDDDHLSERGGAQLIPIFQSIFKPEVQAARAP
ncbi:MAG: hypothetical protein ABS35_41730 [Kaistia sp. SCN 65-12]|nr:MAG: hypothetical protein ABS35_41730 [Kaistia sp. SCN 65-12]